MQIKYTTNNINGTIIADDIRSYVEGGMAADSKDINDYAIGGYCMAHKLIRVTELLEEKIIELENTIANMNTKTSNE